MIGTSAALYFALQIAQSADNTLSLQQAIQIAEQNAFAMRIARRDIEEAEAATTLAKARLSPGAQIVGTGSWFNAESSGGFGPSGSQFTTTVQFQVSQIIDISGINRLRIRGAEMNSKASRAAMSAVLNTTKLQVREAYFGVLQANELVHIQAAAVIANRERLAKAAVRFEAGAIPKFDVLRLESELRKSDRDLTEAQGNFQLAKQRLNSVLGRPIDTEFELAGSYDLQLASQDARYYLEIALSSRPEVEQAQLAIDALEYLRKAEERAALPSMTISGAYQRNLDPGFGQADQQTSAAATISFPIVTGGVVSANAKAAKEREERAKIQFEQLLLAIGLEVHSAFTRLQTAHKNYVSAQQNLVVAEEALRLAQLRYDEGAGILLDVTIAQSEVILAQSSREVAAFQVRTAYAALQQAVGKDSLTKDTNKILNQSAGSAGDSIQEKANS